MTRRTDELCQKHSGMEGRNSLLLWLLGLLIVIGGTQTSLLMGVKAELAGFSYRFVAAENAQQDLKSELSDIKLRLTQLERGEFGQRSPIH